MIHFRRPIVVALLALLAGLVLTLRFPLQPLVFGTAFAVLLFLSLGAGGFASTAKSAATLIILLFVSVGGVLGSLARVEALGDCRAELEDGAPLRVRGTLAAAHRPPLRGATSPLLPLLEPEWPEASGCAGELRVRLPPDLERLAPGDRIEISGTWREFSRPVVASRFPRDPRFYGFVVVESARSLPQSPSDPLLRLRARADARIERLFPSHLELVEALLLGRREYVDSDVRDRFARAGLSHLLAISGMHVGLLAAIALLVTAAMRLSRRRGILVSLLLTWIYLLVIGAGPSAIRAGIMITLTLIAFLTQRPAAAAGIVATAAILILGIRPLSILDPGFQLSFAGVLGILLLRAPLLTLAPDRLQHRSWQRNVADAFIVGVAAFVATAPIVAHHFGILAPVSLIVGAPAVPVMSLALTGAVTALLVHPLLPSAAHLIAAGAALSLDLLQAIATAAANLPFGNAAVPRPPWWTWSLAAAIAFLATRAAPASVRRIRWMIATGSAIATLLLWPLVARAIPGNLQVHFIDVGQGDAIAIRTPAARWILVDAGPASDRFDAGQERVLPYLRDQGAKRLELFVLTHPDLDHIGGAAAVLNGIPVRYVFEPGLPVGKDIYLDLLRGIDTGDAQWRAARSGRFIELDGVRLDFLWPDPETVDATEDANQISAVLRLSFGDFSLLLTGDVGVEVEHRLVERHGQKLEAEVLKLGHHGSATSTAERLLDAVTPELAVVSAGRRNRYGHPAPSVIDRVTARGIRIVGTHEEGSLMLEVGRGGEVWTRREW